MKTPSLVLPLPSDRTGNWFVDQALLHDEFLWDLDFKAAQGRFTASVLEHFEGSSYDLVPIHSETTEELGALRILEISFEKFLIEVKELNSKQPYLKLLSDSNDNLDLISTRNRFSLSGGRVVEGYTMIVHSIIHRAIDLAISLQTLGEIQLSQLQKDRLDHLKSLDITLLGDSRTSKEPLELEENSTEYKNLAKEFLDLLAVEKWSGQLKERRKFKESIFLLIDSECPPRLFNSFNFRLNREGWRRIETEHFSWPQKEYENPSEVLSDFLDVSLRFSLRSYLQPFRRMAEISPETLPSKGLFTQNGQERIELFIDKGFKNRSIHESYYVGITNSLERLYRLITKQEGLSKNETISVVDPWFGSQLWKCIESEELY